MHRFLWLFPYSFLSSHKHHFLETMFITRICGINGTALNLFKVSLSLGRDNEMWFKTEADFMHYRNKEENIFSIWFCFCINLHFLF